MSSNLNLALVSGGAALVAIGLYLALKRSSGSDRVKPASKPTPIAAPPTCSHGSVVGFFFFASQNSTPLITGAVEALKARTGFEGDHTDAEAVKKHFLAEIEQGRVKMTNGSFFRCCFPSSSSFRKCEARLCSAPLRFP